MAQDTRKDPRAKVLTMTVRYKSATIDEFIEHHSHDVSRGGIFIKTPSPFLPGTLLKFEIRIADDKPMLQGVGRVVWKRDAPAAGPDKPAGMGVKFIKVDEASRNLIDRLVTSKGGAISAYDAEVPADAGVSLATQAAAASPPVASARATQPGTRAASPASNRPQPQVASAVTPPAGPVRKATIIGLGADAIAAAAAAAQAGSRVRSAPPRPAGEAMFPKTNSEAEMPPPEERTVMKQAAELLEEALKGAGGSIDELGATQVAPEPSRPAPTQREMAEAKGGAGQYQTVAGVGPLEKRPAESGDQHAPSAQQRPLASQRTPASSDYRDRGAASSRPAALQPVRAVEAPALVEPASKKKGSGGRVVLSLLLVAIAAAGGYVAWQKLAPKPPPIVIEPPPPVATLPPPVPPPVVAPPIETAPPPPAAATTAASAPVAASAPPSTRVKPGAAASATAEKPAPAEKPAAAAPKPKPKAPAEEAAPAEKTEKPAEKPEKKKSTKPAPADDNPY
ncbi:MAG TPA: TIGR02266 family protein [Polyangiaceae bacterium]